MVRLKRHWHKGQTAKTCEAVGQALAVTAWRVARGAVERLLAADYEFAGETHRFGILEEWLVFFVHLADRMAHSRVSEAHRERVIKAMAQRLADVVQENRSERLAAGAYRPHFVQKLNERGADYAESRVAGDAPGMNFLRCLGQAVCQAAPEIDRRWLMEQVVEVEAPAAVRQFVGAAADLMNVSLM